MHVGIWILTKYQGKLIRGMVIKLGYEDLELQLEDGTKITKKYWEVRNVPYDNKKEEA